MAADWFPGDFSASHAQSCCSKRAHSSPSQNALSMQAQVISGGHVNPEFPSVSNKDPLEVTSIKPSLFKWGRHPEQEERGPMTLTSL